MLNRIGMILYTRHRGQEMRFFAERLIGIELAKRFSHYWFVADAELMVRNDRKGMPKAEAFHSFQNESLVDLYA